jgi:hypothetical protein
MLAPAIERCLPVTDSLDHGLELGPPLQPPKTLYRGE